MKLWILAGPIGAALLFSGIPAMSAAPQAAASATHLANAPRMPVTPLGPNALTTQNLGWEASNWSGYAVTGTTYNSVTGSWIVPSVTSPKGTEYSSAWIGIDGFNNDDLIQTGTEQDASSSGSTSYSAWWEILPAAETPITSMTISPGDQMSASIVNNGNGTWTISITDNTTGQNFTTTQDYSGPAQSAEWIMEAPEVNGRIATLAHYGETTVEPTSVNGGNPGLVANDGGAMIQNNVQVSTPSVPNTEQDGFNVAYGSTAPNPPS